MARMIRRADEIRLRLPQIENVLAAAVHRMLLPDPQRRFPSVQNFLTEIRHVKTVSHIPLVRAG